MGPPWEKARDKLTKILHQDSPAADKLAFQKRLKIKRSSPVDERFCNSCLKPLTKKSAMKCATCCEVRYCGRACQVSDWAKHKKDCVPPKPKIQTHGAIHVPEHNCTKEYMWWYNSSFPAGRPMIGVLMTSVETFIEFHGEATYRKTLLSLSLNGYPEFVMMTVGPNIDMMRPKVFQSEAGQDEPPERAGDLDNTRPTAKRRGLSSCRTCRIVPIQRLTSED